jgi:hypothetical protein
MQQMMILGSSAVAFVAVVVAVVAIYYGVRANSRVNRLLAGLEGAGNLGETVEHYFSSVKNIEAELGTIRKNYERLSSIAAASIQKTAIIRFNPFQTTGGDQSFVLALLDNHDNGLILTSIHSREGTRVYIKPVQYGASDHTLSKEEQSALTTARSGDKQGVTT